MKTVFDNLMVAHVWAQQNQPEGRSNNGNFYFRDNTIYSYGPHFPIARILQTKAGAKYVLFTTRGYSISTSRHIGYTRGAVAHLPIFYVRDPSRDDVKTQYAEAIQAEITAAIKERAEGRRNHQARALKHLAEAARIAGAANKYAAFTGQRWRLKAPAVDPAAIEAAANAKAKADAAKKAKEAKQQAEMRAAWLAGEPAPYGLKTFDAEGGGAALRVKGENLETSHGASVPLSHAIKAFKFLKLCRERGKGWERNGHSLRVGHFTIDKVEPDGSFMAGCHTIKWSEVARIANQIGVFNEKAGDDALEPTGKAA